MLSAEEKYNEIIEFIEANIENYTEYKQDVDLVEATISKFRAYVSNCREMNTLMRFLTDRLLRDYVRERKLMAAYSIIIHSDPDPKTNRIRLSVKDQYLNVSGYGDDSAFDKAFKARFHMAPSDAIRIRDESLIMPPLTWKVISAKLADRRDG